MSSQVNHTSSSNFAQCSRCYTDAAVAIKTVSGVKGLAEAIKTVSDLVSDSTPSLVGISRAQYLAALASEDRGHTTDAESTHSGSIAHSTPEPALQPATDCDSLSECLPEPLVADGSVTKRSAGGGTMKTLMLIHFLRPPRAPTPLKK